MSDPTPDFMDPFDDCPWLPARELFRRLGFEPVPPLEVDDFQLRGRLWEFIYALAGRRFYLRYTDHLSDRELYTWLCDTWLDQDVADLPPEAEWNCHLDMTDFNHGTDPIVWLQYYATDKERHEFALEHSLESIPAHADPPHVRDRWLPGPPGAPGPSDEDEFWLDDDAEEGLDDERSESDPLGLAQVDRQIEAEQRRRELTAVSGAEPSADSPGLADELPGLGTSLLPPAELTEETLAAKLWELLHDLACRSFYVLRTDHLGDRELYTELRACALDGDGLMPGKSRIRACFHDCIGSGSEEDIQLSLRYYATPEERAEHAREWPDDPIPPQEPPPFHRDWRLPRAPF